MKLMPGTAASTGRSCQAMSGAAPETASNLWGVRRQKAANPTRSAPHLSRQKCRALIFADTFDARSRYIAFEAEITNDFIG